MLSASMYCCSTWASGATSAFHAFSSKRDLDLDESSLPLRFIEFSPSLIIRFITASIGSCMSLYTGSTG